MMFWETTAEFHSEDYEEFMEFLQEMGEEEEEEEGVKSLFFLRKS